jgi:nitrite reductase/ring-hydroxylating ferredoxin subunit
MRYKEFKMTNIENTMTLCAKSDVSEGSILKVEAGGLSLAVYRVEDVFYVTDDACTHGPGSLSEGYLDGHVIECDFHNGSFDIRNGEVVAPPCLVKLKTYKTVADAEMVLISLN